MRSQDKEFKYIMAVPYILERKPSETIALEVKEQTPGEQFSTPPQQKVSNFHVHLKRNPRPLDDGIDGSKGFLVLR